MCWKGREDGEEETRRRLSSDRRPKTQCEFGGSDGAARSGMSRKTQADLIERIPLIHSYSRVSPSVRASFVIPPGSIRSRWLTDFYVAPRQTRPLLKTASGPNNHSSFLPRSNRFACRMPTTGEHLTRIHLYWAYVLGTFFRELSPTYRLNNTFSRFFTLFLLTSEQTLWILFGWNVANNFTLIMYNALSGELC